MQIKTCVFIWDVNKMMMPSDGFIELVISWYFKKDQKSKVTKLKTKARFALKAFVIPKKWYCYRSCYYCKSIFNTSFNIYRFFLLSSFFLFNLILYLHSIYLSIYLSIYPSIYLSSIYLSIHPSICLYVTSPHIKHVIRNLHSFEFFLRSTTCWWLATSTTCVSSDRLQLRCCF